MNDVVYDYPEDTGIDISCSIKGVSEGVKLSTENNPAYGIFDPILSKSNLAYGVFQNNNDNSNNNNNNNNSSSLN